MKFFNKNFILKKVLFIFLNECFFIFLPDINKFRPFKEVKSKEFTISIKSWN